MKAGRNHLIVYIQRDFSIIITTERRDMIRKKKEGGGTRVIMIQENTHKIAKTEQFLMHQAAMVKIRVGQVP